jgi:hypothetical protein
MFHMVTVCGVCDTAIEDEDYDNRHWDDNGVDEYHAYCCPGCHLEPRPEDAEHNRLLREQFGWHISVDEIENMEAN